MSCHEKAHDNKEFSRENLKPRRMVSPSGGGTGGDPPLPEKLACPPPCPPTVLTQKCRFCYFHAVFGHFVQIVPPLVDPNWETLRRESRITTR